MVCLWALERIASLNRLQAGGSNLSVVLAGDQAQDDRAGTWAYIPLCWIMFVMRPDWATAKSWGGNRDSEENFYFYNFTVSGLKIPCLLIQELVGEKRGSFGLSCLLLFL